jgi:spermidine synthase
VLLPSRRLALLAVGGLGFSSVLTQLALMREMLAAFCGNELALGTVLGNWLLLTGLGAWCGRWADRLPDPLGRLLLTQVAVAVVPPMQVVLLRALRDVFFLRGATLSIAETAVASFLALLPFCMVSGYMLTLACVVFARHTKLSAAGEPGREQGVVASTELVDQGVAISAVYVADGLGSLVGGVLFSYLLIQVLDHFAVLALAGLLNLALAGTMAWRLQRRAWALVAGLLGGGLLGLLALADIDAWSTALQYPRQRLVFRGNSPYGRLVVTESDGQFNFIENGLPMFSTHQVEHVEETVHYAMAQRPSAARVLLVGGGVSGTARELLKYKVREAVYVELDPLVLTVARRLLAASLDDPRLRVVNTDGRLFLKQRPEPFDVIIVDAPDPATAQLNRFYTVEFFREAKRALRPEGVLAFGLGHYENYMSPELAQILATARRSAAASFRNALLLPGGRVFFLVSDGRLEADIASRLEEAGVRNQLVNRHYLTAMLSVDRLAAVRAAAEQAAPMNRDFRPALYLEHLRHWLSQFNLNLDTGRLVAAAAALAVLLLAGVGLWSGRGPGAGSVLFASGFAASALEVVLLLSFQALYGSVYRQLGVIVTVFMAGLSAGAFWVHRRLPASSCDGAVRPVGNAAAMRRVRSRRHQEVAVLALAIAACGSLLPFVLAGLGRLPSETGSLLAAQVAIPLLTFGVAALVGLQFAVAGQVDTGSVAGAAARLYTADLIGACLGAFVAGTLLIPLAGVIAVCFLVGALNAVAGSLAWWRRWRLGRQA